LFSFILFYKNQKLNYCYTNEEIVKNASTVILAVKPIDMNLVLKKISSQLTKHHLLMSLAAGIRLNQIQREISKDVRVIRVMTNIAALIQEGCSVYSRSENCTENDLMFVENLLHSIGTCEGEIDEELIDAVTALSSSGPAYVCYSKELNFIFSIIIIFFFKK
jgi:pyrroline-5-carboxylate reductase